MKDLERMLLGEIKEPIKISEEDLDELWYSETIEWIEELDRFILETKNKKGEQNGI